MTIQEQINEHEAAIAKLKEQERAERNVEARQSLEQIVDDADKYEKLLIDFNEITPIRQGWRVESDYDFSTAHFCGLSFETLSAGYIELKANFKGTEKALAFLKFWDELHKSTK